MTKLGLVLSGGGAKGAYQIGVYRALRKLGKNPEIVTGTSVGAINGVLITQGDLYQAVRLWKNMSFSKIYDENSFEECDNDDLKEIYKEYVKAFISEGGMNISRLLKLFDQMYNPDKFFKSPIDYGLVTYNLSKNEPVIMTKKDFTRKNVKDYVIASASCYPAFKPYKIKDDLYIDGGYYDNMPINLAIELGAEEIIAVDLRSVGFKRKNDYNVPTTIIMPRNRVTNFLVFDKQRSRESLRFGYNDTMKTFGKLDGDRYTFKKGNLVKNYNKYGLKFENEVNYIFSTINSSILNKIVDSTFFKNIKENKLTYRNFNKLIEKAGDCFGFAQDTIYHIKNYNKGLFNELLEIEPISKEMIAKKIKGKDFKKIVDHREIVRFFYDAINTNNFESSLKFLPMFFDDFLIALYIYVTKGQKNAY